MLVYSVDLSRLAGQLGRVRPDALALIFVGYLLTQTLSALKWQLLARPLGFGQPFKTFVSYYFAGMYLNLFAPSIVAGDAARGYLLARHAGRLSSALQSVVADRLSGLVALVWLSGAAFLVFGPSVVPVWVQYSMIGAAGASLLVWWGMARFVAWRGGAPGKLGAWLKRCVGPYSRNTGVVGVVCGLSLVSHVFQLSLHGLLAAALGLGVPWWYLLLVVPVVQILSGLPFSFSGVGVRESGYVLSLGWWGVGSDEALAFGLVWSAVMLGGNLCGGVAVYTALDGGLSLAALRKRLDESG